MLYPTPEPSGRSIIILNKLSNAIITSVELAQEISANFIILMCSIGILSIGEHASIACFLLCRFIYRRTYKFNIRIRYGSVILPTPLPLTNEQVLLQLSDMQGNSLHSFNNEIQIYSPEL